MLATKEDILACFRLLLAREPHPEEISDHFGRVGMPLESVVPIFLESDEFRLRSTGDVEEVRLDGFTIYVLRNDRLIAPGIRRGDYESETVRTFLAHLGDGAVIDIGANCGYYSLVSASRGKTVYAFEPLQINLRLLHAAKIRNSFDSLHIIAGAASCSRGTLRILSGLTNAAVAAIPSVPQAALVGEYTASVRIDDFINPADRISMIKIDVEGHEPFAITGAQETIRRMKPVIISELSPLNLLAAGLPAKDYLDLLRSFGYRLSAIGRPDVTANERLLEMPAGDDHIDILAEPV